MNVSMVMIYKNTYFGAKVNKKNRPTKSDGFFFMRLIIISTLRGT